VILVVGKSLKNLFVPKNDPASF